MAETITWPRKTRELHNHHFDSTIWNHLQFRDDDIIIATYAKSGTTWMQQIIAQMLYGPDPLGGDPHPRGCRRVRGTGSAGTRPRVRAMARYWRGAGGAPLICPS